MNKILDLIKKYWLLLLIGLAFRLILSATTFHLDVKSQMVASATYFAGQLDPYHFARLIHPDTVLDKLPMSYFLDFPFRFPLHFFVDSSKEKIFLLSPNKFFGDPWLLSYLVYAKLPFLFADMLVGILLALLVSPQKQRTILSIWMFNPFTLWATSMIGQIDIYISFFILLSFWLIRHSKFYAAAFVLGIGGAVKSAPFLLLPLLIGLVPDMKRKFLIIFFGVVPFLLTVLPYLPSADFRRDALFTPQLSKMLYIQLPLSGGENLFLNLTLIVLAYIFFFSRSRNAEDFSNYAIAIFLIILSLTHFHLQWVLWIMPLLILWLIDHWHTGTKLAVGILIVSFLMMLFLFEASLQIRLFSPIFPQLDQAKGLWEILPNERMIFLRSIAASLYAGGSFYLVFRLVKQDE